MPQAVFSAFVFVLLSVVPCVFVLPFFDTAVLLPQAEGRIKVLALLFPFVLVVASVFDPLFSSHPKHTDILFGTLALVASIHPVLFSILHKHHMFPSVFQRMRNFVYRLPVIFATVQYLFLVSKVNESVCRPVSVILLVLGCFYFVFPIDAVHLDSFVHMDVIVPAVFVLPVLLFVYRYPYDELTIFLKRFLFQYIAVSACVVVSAFLVRFAACLFVFETVFVFAYTHRFVLNHTAVLLLILQFLCLRFGS